MIRRMKGDTETRKLAATRGSGFMYVGRPSPWGNPYVVGRDGHSNACVVGLFEDYWFSAERAALREEFVRAARAQWNGRTGLALLCWCGPREVCHADVLVGFLSRLAEAKKQAVV